MSNLGPIHLGAVVPMLADFSLLLLGIACGAAVLGLIAGSFVVASLDREASR